MHRHLPAGHALMYRISKQFTFSAGHILAGLPEGHQCGRPHGHNYLAEVRIGADELDGHGFVADYGDLAPFGEWIASDWDHRWLGYGPVTALGREFGPVMEANPTAELIAVQMKTWLLDWLPALMARTGRRVLLPVEVAVSETGKTWAWT